MARLRNVFCMLVVAAVVSAASADTITTLFAGNNRGNPGGGVYFDVTVGALPLEITGFEVNSFTGAGANIAFEVYTRAGTHIGSEGNPAGWTQVATGSGTTAGANIPSAVTLNNTFVLPANSLIGMALTLGPAANHYYTNGTGNNQHFENAPDVALDLGSATNALFAGSPFTPRVWNGSITYTVIPEPATLSLLALGGLALLRRR